MKHLKKLLLVLLVSCEILILNPMQANAAWRQNSTGWWYTENTSWTTGWKNINGTWYYFDSNGYMKTSWLSDNSNWYYLNSSGEMKTGWLLDNSNWYYLQSDGKMKTGWLLDNLSWYYLQSDGKMITSNTFIDKKHCKFNKNGTFAGYLDESTSNDNTNTEVSKNNKYDTDNVINNHINNEISTNNKYENFSTTKKLENKIYNCLKNNDKSLTFQYTSSSNNYSKVANVIKNVFNSKKFPKFIGYSVKEIDLTTFTYEFTYNHNEDITNSDKDDSIYNNNSGDNSSDNKVVISTTNNSSNNNSDTISYDKFYNIACNTMGKLVNEHRLNNGRNKLEILDTLNNSAYLKSKHMVDNNYFDHNYNNTKCFDLIHELSNEKVHAENIALNGIGTKGLTEEGAKDLATRLFNQWKSSDGHNKNMLSSRYSSFGFGFALNKNNNVYATQHFRINFSSNNGSSNNTTTSNESSTANNKNLEKIYDKETLKNSVYAHFNNKDETWDFYYHCNSGNNKAEIEEVMEYFLFTDPKTKPNLNSFAILSGDDPTFFGINLYYN